jgi:hypothetical protein
MSNPIWRLGAPLAVMALTGAIHAGGGYNFTRLVDHDDDFGPRR